MSYVYLLQLYVTFCYSGTRVYTVFPSVLMVTEFLQSCHSLVLSLCYSFGLFIGSLFSSLPVPFPHNLCVFIYSLFSSLPVPFPNSFRLFICSLISSLPVPFPNNSLLLFVLICLVSTLACPRLRLQPNPLVPQPCDSRTRPSPVSRTHNWITLDIIVCQLTTLDCVLFPEACHIKEYLFFFPEFRLANGSCYLSITENPQGSLLENNRRKQHLGVIKSPNLPLDVTSMATNLSFHHKRKHLELIRAYWNFGWNRVPWSDETKIELFGKKYSR